MIIEINNFIFLFYTTLFIKNKKVLFLYFFIQAIASFIDPFNFRSYPGLRNPYAAAS